MTSATVLTGLLTAGLLISLAEPARAQRKDSIPVALKREYGLARFSDCRLDVSIYEGKGRPTWSALDCRRRDAQRSSVTIGLLPEARPARS
jgi:hypothetical protein